jgi:Protein of unknown function (DUF1304)
MFFLACVIIAAIYGAATFSRKILYVQGTLAALALVMLLGASNHSLRACIALQCSMASDTIPASDGGHPRGSPDHPHIPHNRGTQTT